MNTNLSTFPLHEEDFKDLWPEQWYFSPRELLQWREDFKAELLNIYNTWPPKATAFSLIQHILDKTEKEILGESK